MVNNREDQIRKLKKDGKSRKEISRLLGVTEYVVRKALDDPNRGGAATHSMKYRAEEAERKKVQRPGITREECLDDLRSLIERNPHRHVTELAYMAEGTIHYLDWSHFFGNFEEFSRQAGLKPTRGADKLKREIAKQASVDHYEQYYVTEVEPYVGKFEVTTNSKGVKKLVIGSDFHDIEADPFVLAVFIDTCRRIQPDVIILNGDVFDLYEFNRYDIDPRKADLEGRFEFVRERIFRPLREACPNAQIDFILGNHEWRLLKLLADSKNMYLRILLANVAKMSFASIFGVDEFRINIVSKWDLRAFGKDEREEVGKNLKVYYNLFVAKHIGPRSRDEAARKFAMSGTNGHTHRPDMITWNNLYGRNSWVVTGSIARVNQDYVDDPDQAQNGFNIVFIDTERKVVLQRPIVINGDIAEVAGQFYTRQDAA